MPSTLPIPPAATSAVTQTASPRRASVDDAAPAARRGWHPAASPVPAAALALLVALMTAVTLQVVGLRDSLAELQARANRDAAAALASLLSSLPAAPSTSWSAWLEGEVARGRLERVVLLAADGAVIAQAAAPALSAGADRLAAGWLQPVEPGVAPVRAGAAGVDRVEVAADAAAARNALWQGAVRAVAAALVLWGLGVAAGVAGWRRWRRGLDALRDQTEARADSAPLGPGERLPGSLGALGEALERSGRQWQLLMHAQSRQVDALHRQAHRDPVTGLPNRRSFVAELDRVLADPVPAGGSLLIVRLLDLGGVNLRLGFDATDRLLAAVGDLLGTYPERVAGAFVGRLGGSDFALCLPVGGVGKETAATLMAALRASPAGSIGGIEAVVGGVEGLAGLDGTAVLSRADEALAHAEMLGPGSVEVRPSALAALLPGGARAWRERIGQALEDRRMGLSSTPIRAPDGTLLGLDCTVCASFGEGEPYLPTGRWLALAARSRLLPQVDLAGVEMALRACAADGTRRSLRISPACLDREGFVDDVVARLRDAPSAARLLQLQVGDGASAVDPALLAVAAAAWRGCGAGIGLVHAGADSLALACLAPAALDHVVLDARVIGGAAAEAAMREHLRSLVILLHGRRWQVFASGVADPADLAALWALAIDGAAGPAVDARTPQGEPVPA